ncbi:beta-lactamase family protein [candidate division KSB1 bacterium]|nr:beta-lactamase family protein [candidate division KSB1 bacterium]
MNRLCNWCVFLLILSLSFLRLSVPCHSQTNISKTNTPHRYQTIDTLKAEIDSLMNKYKIPGAAFAIVSKDTIYHVGGLGYADINLKTPVNEKTLFRVGSITKSFTALGILKLVEAGNLDLQAPVKQVLPELALDNPWEASEPVRVVHLLEHTAGLNDPHFNDYYLDGDPDVPLMQGVSVSKHYLEVRWKPGSFRSYSSAGYMIAGMVIEKITGERFEDYLKKEFFDPIGMVSSGFRLTSEARQLFAQGYKGSYQKSEYWYSYSRPAGSMYSSANDIARYLQFMLNQGKSNGRQIIAASTIDRMEKSTTDPALKAGLESRGGLGIGVGYYKGFKWYSHHGSIMGFCGAYGYSHELNIGCVLLTNRWDVDFETGITKLWDALRKYLVKDVEITRQPPVQPEISMDQLKLYTGYYKWCNPPQKLSAWIDLILNYQVIKLKEDGLYYKEVFFGAWNPLIPVTPNSFRAKNNFHASKAFITSEDNKQIFINGGDIYQKTAGWMPWLHGLLFGFAWIILLSVIFYTLVWIPVELYKRITHKNTSYLPIRLLPFVAIILLLVSFSLVGMQVEQSLAYLGQKTFANVFFYISTWIFALFSFVNLFFIFKSYKKPVKNITRIYLSIVALSCVGITLYWGYWGIIGLKFWSY